MFSKKFGKRIAAFVLATGLLATTLFNNPAAANNLVAQFSPTNNLVVVAEGGVFTPPPGS